MRHHPATFEGALGVRNGHCEVFMTDAALSRRTKLPAVRERRVGRRQNGTCRKFSTFLK